MNALGKDSLAGGAFRPIEGTIRFIKCVLDRSHINMHAPLQIPLLWDNFPKLPQYNTPM